MGKSVSFCVESHSWLSICLRGNKEIEKEEGTFIKNGLWPVDQVLFSESQHPVEIYMACGTHQVNISRAQCLEACVEGLRHAVLMVPPFSMNVF